MKSTEKVIVVGSSGHAGVIIDTIEQQNFYTILGVLDKHQSNKKEVLGYKIIGRDEDLPVIISAEPNTKLIVAIGDNWIRHKVVQKLQMLVPEVLFATVIHPTAYVATRTKIGPGSVIMAGAVVNSHTNIGSFGIVNTRASIDHDSNMEYFSSLAPGVTTGGHVRVGAFSAVSIGSTIKHSVNIGTHTVIGAASLVLNDIPDNVVAYGMPAKIIRGRSIGESYL